jgi:hypothetical protein
VSLLLPETLHLYIAQDKVLGVKTAGLNSRVVAHGRVNATVDSTDGWTGVTSACGSLLKNMLTVDRLRVVLSSAFVRFTCVPWRADLRSSEEELALAKMQFDDTYGADASVDWHFAFSDMQAGRSSLSVATPDSLYTLLRSGLPAGTPKVASIDTAFTCVAHANRKHMPGNAWFVNVEGQRLTLGHWNQSGWVWMNTLRTVVNSFDEFAVLLKRELTISGATLSAQAPIVVVVNASNLNAQNMKVVDGVRFVFLKAAGVHGPLLQQDADFSQLGLAE